MPDAIKARFPPRLRTLLDSSLPFFHIPVDAPSTIVNTSASTAGLPPDQDDLVIEVPRAEEDVVMEPVVANDDASAPPA
jgi:hypothetical protein